MAQPIWRDTFIEISGFGVFSHADFAILFDGNVIYEGRAYPKNGEDFVDIKINDICANYLGNTFPSIFPTVGTEAHSYSFDFTVQYTAYFANGDIADQAEEEVSFVYDWSFDYARSYDGSDTLLAPIVRLIPSNAPVLFTAGTNPSVGVTVTSGLIPLVTAVSDANNVIQLPPFASKVTIKTSGNAPSVSYKVVEGCYRYMLYYLNAFGGWDFLLIEGKELKTDEYTRHTFGKTYDNRTSRNRGGVNYRNDIVRRWTLHTLWIDDAGAQNMHHLLGSTDVYLYDMESGELHPVTLTNSSCEYRTYSNNGNQLVRYDIEASLAQTITRR